MIGEKRKRNVLEGVEPALLAQYDGNRDAMKVLKKHFKKLDARTMIDIHDGPSLPPYSSYFFRKDVVDRFAHDVRATAAKTGRGSVLSAYNLYNADDLLQHIGQRGTFHTRHTNASAEYQAMRQKNIAHLVKHLANNMCFASINRGFAKDSGKYSLDAANHRYDVVVVSTAQLETIGLPRHDAADEDDDTSDTESSPTESSPTDSATGGQPTPSPLYFAPNVQDAAAYDSDDPLDEDYVPDAYVQDPSLVAAENMDAILAHRLRGVMGFIVVQLGECDMYPHAYALNLVCTHKDAGSGLGSLLMGLYLYTIMAHPNKPEIATPMTFPPGKAVANTITDRATDDDDEISFRTTFFTEEPLVAIQQVAILELAAAYANPGGLCVYEKFGFRYDEQLLGAACFEEVHNLPMIIDILATDGYFELGSAEQMQQKVVDITVGANPGFAKSPICSVRDIRTDSTGARVVTREQSLLGRLLNLKQIIVHEPSYLFLPPNSYSESIRLKSMYATLLARTDPSAAPQNDVGQLNAVLDVVDECIRYLETPVDERTESLIRVLAELMPAYAPPVRNVKGGGGQGTTRRKRHRRCTTKHRRYASIDERKRSRRRTGRRCRATPKRL